MVHRVESGPEEVYRYLPILLPVHNTSFFRLLLVIPDDVDLRYQIGVALSFSVSFQIFLQNRVIVRYPRMCHRQQPKTASQHFYFYIGS